MISLLSLLLFSTPIQIEVEDGEVFQWQGEAEDSFELDELKLGDESEIQLPNFKSIRIRRLIASQNSRIKIAVPNSGDEAVEGADGAHGAKTILLFDSIDGHVIVESKGGNGGDGRDGRNGQQGVRGAKGRDAFRFLFFYLGNGDDGYPGAKGEEGEDGQDGGRGGDGGLVKIYYREKSPDAQILVEVDAGRGGRGGKAGMGGLGGNGGPGGRGIQNGRQGPMGRPGENARPGRPGEPGSPGSVSIFQVDRKFYSCLIEIYYLDGNLGSGACEL